MKKALFAGAACALLASGCAVIDPHGILSRNVREGNSDYQIQVLGPWGRTAAFDFVFGTVNDKYVDPKFNGVDWKATAARYRPQALDARSDDDFWEVLNRMTGELRDSHTRVESPRLVEQRRRQEAVSLGLEVDRVEGRIAVVYVAPDSEAWWAGVRPGMAVERIDGAPTDRRYAAVLAAEREQSTPWAKERRAFRTLLVGEPGTKTDFAFVRDDGSTFSATLSRRVVRNASSAMSRRLPSGYGYIRFTGFSLSVRGQVMAALESQRDAPGLIIDLRNNGGGLAMMAEDVARHLLRQTTDVGSIITRTGEPVTLFGFPVERMKRTLEGSPDAYDKPVVIIVNAGSASASELLAGGLQDVGRVKVVGQRSCGCLLGFLGYATIPGGAELAYAEIGMVSAKGRRIEREGVIPDVEVSVTAADLRLYRDRPLEEAQNLLSKIAAEASTKN